MNLSIALNHCLSNKHRSLNLEIAVFLSSPSFLKVSTGILIYPRQIHEIVSWILTMLNRNGFIPANGIVDVSRQTKVVCAYVPKIENVSNGM